MYNAMRHPKEGVLIIDDMNPTREVLANNKSRLWPQSKVNETLYRQGKMSDTDAREWELIKQN